MIMHFLNGLAIIMDRLVGLLPTFDAYPDGVYTAFTAMAGYWGMLDFILPMGTITIVLGFILVTEGVFFGYKIAMKIWSLLPFSSKQ